MTSLYPSLLWFFFFNDTATTEIYTLSLHDALPISTPASRISSSKICGTRPFAADLGTDRKSTRLNSSHTDISRMPSSSFKKNQNSDGSTFATHNTAACVREEGERQQ